MYETAYSYFINPATKKFLQTNEAHSPITTPPSFYFGDRPKFTLSFPANTLGEGDAIIAVLDNENRFLDSHQATGLNPVMCGVINEVTSEEATSGTIEVTPFNFSKKFADVVNGHDEPVTCLFTIYQKSVDEHDNFTFLELGQTLAYANPTTTSPELIFDDLPISKYYTREELDAVYQQFLDGVALVIQLSKLAESYAVGGTGTREGENTDNAKYYAEMAQQAAQAVTTMYGEIQTLATQVANTKDYIDGLVVSIATDIRDISAIAASVTEKAAQVSRDAQSVRQAKSSIDASVLFVTNAKSTIENLATQVSQNALNVANDKDAVQQLASQVANAASQVAQNKADAKGYADSAANTLTSVQAIQTDVTQKQTAITSMKNTIQGWYTQIRSWYNSISQYMEQMLGWWTDVDTWQQQVSADKAIVVSAKDTAVQAKDDAVAAKTAAETAQEKAETAQEKAEDAQEAAEQARDEAVSTLANKRDILQTLVSPSSTALEVEAGKSYKWTVSAPSTISMKAADKVANKETRIDIYIDLQSGGSVTGSGVVIADSVLQSGWYKLIWDGTNATLYSTKAGGAESVITIPASTTAYSLADNKHYQQVPSGVPTYTIPAVTMDGLVHEITILVDFLHVTSCSFVDASNVPVTLQSAISPQIGEAYVFRCYWYGKWRVVPLKIRNAATVSSATGVVEVTDSVAGDALALKMTAPRSVVVNQLVQNGNFSEGVFDTSYWNTPACTATVQDNACSLTYKGSIGYFGIQTKTNIMQAGHKYIYRYEFRVSFTANDVSTAFTASDYRHYYNPTVNTWLVSSGFLTPDTLLTLRILAHDTTQAGDTLELKNIQLVDLTAYFNGDTTLIDSITSWDDLVAYDPRFAQYVEYNTGTVTGVQPTVKVSGKNLWSAGDQSFTKLKDISVYLPAGTYTFSSDVVSSDIDNSTCLVRVANASGRLVSVQISRGTSQHTSFTIEDTATSIGLYASVDANSSTGDTATFSNIQLELGSTATSYEPYHDGGTAQAPAPLFAVGTAADEFEAVSGVTTHKMASVDLGTLNDWYSTSGIWRSYALRSVIAKPVSQLTVANITADKYIPIANQHMNSSRVGIISVNPDGNLYVSNGSTTVVPSGVLYYELATPTTSQSTPTQISLQAGSNVAMQTDGGRTLAELALTYENLPSEG